MILYFTLTQINLILFLCQFSLSTIVNRTTMDQQHQPRIKRAKGDHRWPSNLENWQLNDVKFGLKTSSSSSQSVTVTPIAENIKCSTRKGSQSFTSTLSLPSGYTLPPIFEDSIEGDSVAPDCSMSLTSSKVNMYNMRISDFDKCGVKWEKSSDGKEWMSVALRIPFIKGLRTAQDEHIVIVCRPQDPFMAKSQILDFRTNLLRPPRTVYSSLEPEVEVKVGLFAKPSGVSFYSEEIPVDGIIEIGEELQFRAIVRPGDGWKYAKLTDLRIYHVDDNSTSQPVILSNDSKSGKSTSKDSKTLKQLSNAILVLENGCRNPIYSALAPYHPYRDTSNPLAVAFNFKAFMFQDMPDDGSIRITAKIMACMEEADCAPTLCLDNGGQAFGRRKRYIHDTFDGETLVSSEASGLPGYSPIDLTLSRSSASLREHLAETSNFSRNFQVKVVLPGYAKTTLQSISSGETTRIELNNRGNCKTALLMMASVSAILCSSITLAAICSLRVKATKNGF